MESILVLSSSEETLIRSKSDFQKGLTDIKDRRKFCDAILQTHDGGAFAVH
ncbi:hypothetical protein AVEN_50740-1, partial [Araneus ventricosus]